MQTLINATTLILLPFPAIFLQYFFIEITLVFPTKKCIFVD